MKSTKKIAALMLAAVMIMACAACGSALSGVENAEQDKSQGETAVAVETVAQNAESSDLMQAVYHKLTGSADYAQMKEMYEGLAHFEEELKGDTIEITVTADNEWYESMNGTWDYVLDGDYITMTAGQEEYTGMMIFSSVTSAVAEYLGMDPELVRIYISALTSQEMESEYYIIERDDTAGTVTEKIYVAGQYDMQPAIDTAYIEKSALDYMEPLNEDSRNFIANAGKVSMSAEGTKDSVDIVMAEYGGNSVLTYKSLLEVVNVLQPDGYEQFLEDYTSLIEAETEKYQVKFLSDSDELPYAFEDYSSNYQFMKVHFGE